MPISSQLAFLESIFFSLLIFIREGEREESWCFSVVVVVVVSRGYHITNNRSPLRSGCDHLWTLSFTSHFFSSSQWSLATYYSPFPLVDARTQTITLQLNWPICTAFELLLLLQHTSTHSPTTGHQLVSIECDANFASILFFLPYSMCIIFAVFPFLSFSFR